MYAGHAAIALALKSRRPDVPIIPLALACFGPDWIDAALMASSPIPNAVYSHSIPAIVIGAVIASGLYALVGRRPGALVVLAGWLLHWPADLLTAHKPMFGAEQLIGLDLYHLPAADAVLESVVIMIACRMYMVAFAHSARQRRVVHALAVALMLLQAAFLAELVRTDTNSWTPLLAIAP